MNNVLSKLSMGLLLIIVLLAVVYWSVGIFNHSQANTQSQWSGVDETVIEKFAAAEGREAVTPLINTDQGDLLLFVFAVAGAAGGFIAGYCWRILVNEKK